MLLEDIRDPTRPPTIADRLQAALLEPFDDRRARVYASASIGIAFGNGRYRNSDDLLRDADTAMYRAKALGRSQCQTFDPSMHASAIQRLTLETQLRRALERQEFSLHYQPIIELETSDVCGFEALVRWKRPDGTVDASRRIHPGRRRDRPDRAARRTGCCARPAGRSPNGSGVRPPADADGQHLDEAVRPPTLVDEVRAAIATAGCCPGTLRLEITESFLARTAPTRSRERLDELRVDSGASCTWTTSAPASRR